MKTFKNYRVEVTEESSYNNLTCFNVLSSSVDDIISKFGNSLLAVEINNPITYVASKESSARLFSIWTINGGNIDVLADNILQALSHLKINNLLDHTISSFSSSSDNYLVIDPKLECDV